MGGMMDFTDQRNTVGTWEYWLSGDRWLCIYSGCDLPPRETSIAPAHQGTDRNHAHLWDRSRKRFCLLNQKAMAKKEKGVFLKQLNSELDWGKVKVGEIWRPGRRERGLWTRALTEGKEDVAVRGNAPRGLVDWWWLLGGDAWMSDLRDRLDWGDDEVQRVCVETEDWDWEKKRSLKATSRLRHREGSDRSRTWILRSPRITAALRGRGSQWSRNRDLRWMTGRG